MSIRRHALALPLALCCAASTLRAQVSIVGTVTDSVSGRPLAGTLVQIMRDSSREARSTHSDSLGTFRFDSLTPGTYLIGFFDPMLDSLGIELNPRVFRVGPGGPTREDLAIPSPRSILAGLCPTVSAKDSVGLLLGHVRDAESGLPRVGEVTVSWMELSIGQGGIHKNRQIFPTKTDAMGWYALCGVPGDADLTASARADSLESGVVEVHVPAGGLLIRDFLVSRADSMVAVYGDSTGDAAGRKAVAMLRRGHSRLAGLVHNDKGEPVRDAEVSVPGTGLQTHTGDAGTFGITGLPAGTQTLDVRAIGFEPKRIAVDLRSARLTNVDVPLEHRVRTLDVVKIYGTGNRGLGEFERRLKAGWGHILTPADIAKRNALNVSDLFRTIPGVRVTPTRGFGSAILLRGGCLPTVYLNGMRMSDDAAASIDELASADEITAVEVYTPAGRPPEFWGNSCGTVVLWAGVLPR